MSSPPPSVDRPVDAPQDAGPTGGLAFVTRRPVGITMFFLAIAVFGFVSLSKLSVDLMPEISYPSLTVRSTWPGAAPEDIEDRVSERVQEALSTLPALVRSTSISRAEVSDVVLEFEWGTPMTFAVQDVREKLDGVFLPAGAERPLILRYDPNLDPILRIGVTLADDDGDEATAKKASVGELVKLRWIAENRIKRELETLPGVAAVQVRGGLEEEIKVSVDPHRMAAQNVDPGVLAQRLAAENVNASGGRIREGSTEYLVRTLNEFTTVAEIEELPIERRGLGVIRVRDVAKVERTHAEREVISRIAGKEAVEIAIYREAGANVVDLAQRVKDALFGTEEQREYTTELGAEGAAEGSAWSDREKTAYLAWRLRDDVELATLSDQSTFIRAAIDDVRQAAVLGAILAVAVILVFLRRIAPTLIVGVAIPISVIVTFAPMFLLDVSLNLMSLGGLALGIGMLVDNAIVVIESIARCREEGDELRAAAVRGVREVAGAITASTLTTICVFLPIVFVHGVAGQIFGDQAITVVSSLGVSLIVAVLFIPMLASRRWLSGERTAVRRPPRVDFRSGLSFKPWQLPPTLFLIVARVLLYVVTLIGFVLGFVLRSLAFLLEWVARVLFEPVWRTLDALYPPFLKAAIRLAWIVLPLAGWLSYDAFGRVTTLGTELLPEIHQGEFTVFVALDVGKPLEETDRVMGTIARQVEALDEVLSTAVTVGVEKDSLTREIEGKHTARLTVRSTEAARGPEAELALQRRVEDIVSSHPAVALAPDTRRPTPFAQEPPVQVEILGYDLASLEEVGRDVVARLSRAPEIAEVRSSVRPGHPEARVTFDRDKILEYGLDLGVVSAFVRDQVLGNVSTRFHEGDERIDVRVMGDEVVLSNLERVLDLVLNPAEADPVRLRSVAKVERVQGPAEIRRIGNTRAVVVTAQGEGLALGGLAEAIDRELEGLRHPDDVTVELGGQKRDMDEAQESMKFALLLAVFLVYVVMASQFESLLQPLVILVSVPLAGVGVVYVLEALGVTLSVIVFIGLIMLAGIVVNNAIVLIDRINQRRAAGVGLEEAILEAGRARLRPILMTTATTVLGLLPLTGWLAELPVLAVGAGEGAEIRAPLAITVIAGLISSTLLTLVVVPVVYFLVERTAQALRPRRADAGDPHESAASSTPRGELA